MASWFKQQQGTYKAQPTRSGETNCSVCARVISAASWPATVSDPVRGYEGVCLACSGRGHSARDCPSPPICLSCRRAQPLGCSVCGGVGHQARECPSPLCRRCGSRGHYEASCLIAGPMPVTYTLHLAYAGEDLGLVLAGPPGRVMEVVQIRDEGPADAAGVKVGMRVESIDGHKFTDNLRLYDIMGSIHSRRETIVQLEARIPQGVEGSRPREHGGRVGSQGYPGSEQLEGHSPAYAPDGTRVFAGSPPPIPRNPSMNPLNDLNRKSPKFV